MSSRYALRPRARQAQYDQDIYAEYLESSSDDDDAVMVDEPAKQLPDKKPAKSANDDATPKPVAQTASNTLNKVGEVALPSHSSAVARDAAMNPAYHGAKSAWNNPMGASQFNAGFGNDNGIK